MSTIVAKRLATIIHPWRSCCVMLALQPRIIGPDFRFRGPFGNLFADSRVLCSYDFGSIRIDGVTYERDLVIDRGKVRKRKKPSRKFREEFGHTPVSVEEKIPWKCRRRVVGTGKYGSLPVMDTAKLEALRRKIELVILPTDEAIDTLATKHENTNAILHVTC